MNNSIETINQSELITVKGDQEPMVILIDENLEGHDDCLLSDMYGNTEDVTFHKSWFVQNTMMELNEDRTPIEMSVFVYDTSRHGHDKTTKHIMVPSEFVIHGSGSKLEMFNPCNPTLM